MPNQCIELHDSQLAVLWYEGAEEGPAIFIFSHLYVHQSEGRPGVDPGIGWFQRAELVIEKASLTEFISDWPCLIYDGEVEIDGVTHDNCAPLPLKCKESFRILMEAVDRSGNGNPRRIEIKGTGAELTFLGKPSQQEDFSGMKGR